jgi:polyferredoxin
MIQILTALITNSYLVGFLKGKIFTGNSKHVCVPGLNCYSCPGAVGACPIGSLQAVLGSAKYNFSYYIFGTLLFFGVMFGRLICGFLCPFGLIQDLLYKIKVPKIKVPEKIDKVLRFVKYIMLVFPVILLPIFLTDQFKTAEPYFCKWVCPAGTLEGGIPLVIKNESLRQVVGYLFDWKLFLLAIFILSSVFIYRPFCKYICPLGAIYSLFNRFSFYQMNVDKFKCNGCKACERNCKMNVKVTKNINSAECIRCGECISVCKQGAISPGFEIIPKISMKENGGIDKA